MENEGGKRNFTPFKRRLIYFASAIIGFIAIIVIPIEAQRPLNELHQLIANAKNLVAGTQSSFQQDEINRMNRFAMGNFHLNFDDDPDGLLYYDLSFNFLVLDGQIPSKEQVIENLEYLSDFENPYDHGRLLEAGAYWSIRFSEYPGLLKTYQKYKKILMQAGKNAREAGFQLAGISIMLDSGEKKGFFENQIAFLLDSYNAWEEPSAYTGEPYEITDNEFWRASALSGTGGFGNNPISSPENYYLPRFDEDEWGTWFSVWLTRQSDGMFNIYNIDFNAARVKRLMMAVGLITLGVMVILVLMVILVTGRLSRLVTRPITELTKGAEKVARGEYDYEVPIIKADEFGELTRQFNLMTKGQKQRFNLMVTLEKLLSKELAKKAAESGMVLGGKQTHCTIMFTDFAGFSTITQKMPAQKAVELLNFYYTELIAIVKKHGGFPDKYIGDAIVALFGAPVWLEDHAERAVSCAIEMQRKIREINDERRQRGQTVFEMRVGINSGEVIVGAIGCDMKLEYTSIGETTNLANRMETICKIGHVMMAEGTYMQIKNIFFKGVNISIAPERVRVKGYPQPVATYGIYVHNLMIQKDFTAENPERDFYRYLNVNHYLKNSIDEVTGIELTRETEYL